ncbi:MAG: MBL fold metallo-hydrolase [Lachnospiraceae bacterium]|nr:MBL fold metallo-hydrolase [Lachnospiraceae bacterium]
MLRRKTLVVGGLETNCYLVWNEASKEGFLVDPGSDPEWILSEIRTNGISLKAILLTHGHFDHMLAVPELLKRLPVPVFCGKKELEMLSDPSLNLSYAYCGPMTVTADRAVTDGEELLIAGFRIRVLETPGHTVGSVSYYLPDEALVFSGDTLFFETFGNTKLPTGSFKDITDSIRNKLLKLPDETTALPGHDRETNVGHEKQVNPLRGWTFG